jgi:hypothetical protein
MASRVREYEYKAIYSAGTQRHRLMLAQYHHTYSYKATGQN